MKKISTLIMISMLVLSLGACKKGDDGTAGTNGTNGTDGKDGAAGKDGNANVMEFSYGTRTFTGAQAYDLPATINQGLLDSSLVLAYYNPSTEAASAWYPVPGAGSSGAYITRSFWYNSSGTTQTFSVRLMSPDGSATYANPVTFTKLKIIIAPAGTITAITAKGVDPGSYEEVKSMLLLKD